MVPETGTCNGSFPIPKLMIGKEDVEDFFKELEGFHAQFADCFSRQEPRDNFFQYMVGQMSHLERKSIEPIALHVEDAKVRAMQHFISDVVWDDTRILSRYHGIVAEDLGDTEGVLIFDESGFVKKGSDSTGVSRQYCGSIGKVENCQVGVFVAYASRHGYCMLGGRLFIPEKWFGEGFAKRRIKNKFPADITFKTKPQLALDLVDGVRGWGLQNRLVLADSLYGDGYEFRQGLRSRQLDYVVQVSGELMAWTKDPHPPKPPMKRGGKIPRKRFYAKELPPARSLCQIAKELPSQSWKKITWREGTKGPLSSRFARVIVWMANGLIQGKTMEVPSEELLIEWPEGKKEPLKYWLSSLSPHRTSWRGLVRKAKGRFRIEQDYEEMKGELGLDHFEGRSWQGWHHHVTLVTLAYAFLMLERIGNKKNFWIDVASCPPMDPEMLAHVYRHMSNLW